MALTFTVRPGYSFSSGEKVTYSKLNLLGSPRIEGSGTVGTTDIDDLSVTTEKLAASININSKIDDHNLGLNKLAQGTHGQVLYYDAEGDLVTLPPGTSGYFLSTNGAGQNPSWKAALTGDGTVAYNAITTNGLSDQYLTTDSSGAVEWIAKPTSNSASVYDTTDLAAIIAAGTPYVVTQAHGLGVVPEQVVVTLRCISDDSSNTGYVEGDEIPLHSTHCDRQGETQEFPPTGVSYDSTNVILQTTQYVKTSLARYYVKRKDGTGSPDHVAISSSGSKFQFRIRVWAQGSGSSASNNAGPLTSEAGYYFSGTASDSFQTMRGSTNASGRTATFSHGFGAVPRLVKTVVVLTEAISELGYAAGDEIDAVNFVYAFRDFQIPIVHTHASSDSVKAQLFTGPDGNYATVIYAVNSSTTVLTALTADQMSKMKLKVYAWK